MKAFIDTSALVKKYIQENGSDNFDKILAGVNDVGVAPIYWLELNSAVARRLKDKSLTKSQAEFILQESRTDLNYFQIVVWNEQLENQSSTLIHTYRLKTLDSIQLACARLSECDMFITSDQTLASAARLEHIKTILIT